MSPHNTSEVESETEEQSRSGSELKLEQIDSPQREAPKAMNEPSNRRARARGQASGTSKAPQVTSNAKRPANEEGAPSARATPSTPSGTTSRASNRQSPSTTATAATFSSRAKSRSSFNGQIPERNGSRGGTEPYASPTDKHPHQRVPTYAAKTQPNQRPVNSATRTPAMPQGMGSNVAKRSGGATRSNTGQDVEMTRMKLNQARNDEAMKARNRPSNQLSTHRNLGQGRGETRQGFPVRATQNTRGMRGPPPGYNKTHPKQGGPQTQRGQDTDRPSGAMMEHPGLAPMDCLICRDAMRSGINSNIIPHPNRHPEMNGYPTHQDPESAQPNGGSLLQRFAPGIFGEGNQTARQLQQAHEGIRYLERQLAAQCRTNEGLNTDLVRLQSTNKQFETELRQFQVKSFKTIVKESWTPMEDIILQEKLAEIHKDIEDWVDENCIKSYADFKDLTQEEEMALIDFLGLFVCMGGGGDGLLCQLRWWEDRLMDLVLIPTAIITHLMYTTLFRNPFLAFSGVIDEEENAENVSNCMMTTYKVLLTLNREQAHRWRSQLMRILFPKPLAGGKFDGLCPANEEITNYLRRKCEMFVSELENWPIRAFLKDDRAEDCREQMIDCWYRAAELFTQLQTQLPEVIWTDGSKLDLLRQPFNEQYMEAHRSQAFPRGNNAGKPTGLVISPAVSLRGNEDGERYDVERVVSKATVLVLDEENFAIDE